MKKKEKKKRKKKKKRNINAQQTLSRLVSGSLLVGHVRPASVMVEPDWGKAITLLWVKPEWGETHSCWEACWAGGGPEIGLAQRWLCTSTEIYPPTTIVHLSPLPPLASPHWKYYVRSCKNCIAKLCIYHETSWNWNTKENHLNTKVAS